MEEEGEQRENEVMWKEGESYLLRNLKEEGVLSCERGVDLEVVGL